MSAGPNQYATGRKLLWGAALWFLGACMQPGTEAPVAGSGTELGNVMGILTSPDGSAAAGVEVLLHPMEETLPAGRVLRAATDSEGAFAFQVTDGSFRLLALDRAGNGVTVDSLLPSADDTIDLREIALQPLGSIRGVVKSRPSGSQLKLLGTPFDTAFPGDTDFLWEGIPAGTFRLQARQSAGMVVPNSRQSVVTVVPGTVTVLPDTLDLSTLPLEIQSLELPYRFIEVVRPSGGIAVDSVFCVLDGVRLAGQGRNPRAADITLTESMLDTARPSLLQVYVHSADSLFIAHAWTITLIPNRNPPAKWAYQAVRAVITALEPDDRPAARRPGAPGGDPMKGTFRVLEKRHLSPGELEYWEWPAAAGGDAPLPESILANILNFPQLLGRGCHERPEGLPLNLPGDTVTFFLLPDSMLGAVAFRLRTDERFEDMDRLGYFARADWPLGKSLSLLAKKMELHTALRPEGLRIAWPRNFMSTVSGCLPTYRRFLVDSTGQAREIIATPPGLDPTRLLLHYRAEIGAGIDADSLPSGGAYVYIDSLGEGVAGNADSTWSFQLSEGELQELKTVMSGLPDPIPSDWNQEFGTAVWIEGLRETLRYLVSDQRGSLHILDHAGASPDKADLFSRVETWLRGRSLL